MTIKFIERANGLIVSHSDRPSPKKQEQIATDSVEFIAFEAKTGDYAVVKTAIENRIEAYGSAEVQLEFITENGLDAFVARQEAIKTQFPK